MSKTNENKSQRLQSLDQDVLAVSEQKKRQNARNGAASGRSGGAPAGGAPAGGGGGGAGTGMVVTVSIMSVLLLFSIAAGVLYGLYMHEQMKGIDGGPDINLDKALAPLEQRVGELETRVQSLASQGSDDGGGVSVDTLNRLKAVEKKLEQLGSTVSNVERRSESALKIARDARGKVSGLESTLSEHGSRLDTLAGELDSLSQKVAGMGQSSAQDDIASQVQHLNGRVEKLSDDISSIYRILESR